jgi:Putative zinc-finger
MTATTYHGAHPEAELLSAFAERALPEHERHQVLAHLSVCSRCRQVVALAARAGELEPNVLVAAAAAAVPSLATPVARRPVAWWRNWHFAWIPVAALAVTVSLVAYIHTVHIDRAAQLARNNPPAVSQNETQPAAPAPPAPIEQRKPAPQPSAKARPLPHSEFATVAPPELPTSTAGAAAPPRAILSELQPPPPQPPPSATETVTVASDRPGPETGSAQQFISIQPSSRDSNSLLRATPPPPAASPASPQLQAEREKKFAEFNRQVDTAEAGGHLSAGAALPQSAPVGTAVSGSSTSASVYTQSAASHPDSNAIFGSVHGFASNGGLAGIPIHLPSGLALASIASSGRLMLAIDNSGALFLTQDSGLTWRQVARQWSGRAILVRTRNLLAPRALTAPAAASDGEFSSGSPAPPAPSIVFEIVNEKNQVWQSADGLVWVAK